MVAKKTHPILLRVNHDNIVDYLGIFINEGRYFSLTEHADCGSLCEYISGTGRNATDLMRINWMRQLASALIYLHTQNLIHKYLNLNMMFLADNYETLKLSLSVGNLRTNVEKKLQNEVFLFINVLVNVMTNMKYSYGRFESEIQPIITNIKNKYKNVDHITKLIIRRPDPLLTMKEVQFILAIDHTLELDYGEWLGQGSFGEVYKAIWVTGDGTRKTVAAKKLNDFSGFKGIDREITILSQLQHTNIVSFLHITVDNGRPVIIMEYADCRSVYDYLHVYKGKSIRVPDFTQVKWMQHCANGLAYLHEKNILHRDLKTKNLVLTDNFQTLKICDFGLVKYVDTTNTSRQGTYGYMAPEVGIGRNYSTKCDVFSFGIVLWEIMSKKKPSYDVASQGHYFAKQFQIHQGVRPDPDDAKDFSYIEYIKKIMEKCWAQEAANRPEMKDVVSDLCNDFTFDLEYEEKIGHGSFADVYKAIWKTEDGTRKIVAAKKLRSMDGFKRIHKVITMLSRLKHENILSFLDIIVDVDRPVILMEYAFHKSIYNLLHNVSVKFGDRRKMEWIVQCANGLAFLHEENVLHCDLKTKNLMLNDELNLKICDFGLVNNFETTKRPSIGTNGYMAPEVCLGRKYTTKSDVFSFGIVLWEIMSGKKPLYEFESDGILQYNSDEGYRPKPEDAETFMYFYDINSIMVQCWAQEEANRPTMKDVILYFRNTHIIIREFIKTIHYGHSDISKVITVSMGGTRTTVAQKTYPSIFSISVQNKFDAEVLSLLHLNHTNIVSLLDLRLPNESYAILVHMEYADSGSLYDYLHGEGSSDRRVIDVARLNWMIQCANGLAYLHEQNVLHGNLKTRKMLLTDNFRTLKICDFGRIKDIISSYRPLSSPRYYIAPEVEAEEDFTTKCDVFQYGCVFWELMCDKMPIEKLKNQKIDIITGKRPKLDNLKYTGNIDLIKSIITQCWAQDKAERPTMQEVVLRLGVESQLPDDIFTRIRVENVNILDAVKNKFKSLF